MHKHDANLKKLDTKGHTVYDPMYIKPTEQVNISKLKVDQQLAEAGAKGEWRMTTMHTAFPLGVMEMFWNQVMVVVRKLYKHSKKH